METTLANKGWYGTGKLLNFYEKEFTPKSRAFLSARPAAILSSNPENATTKMAAAPLPGCRGGCAVRAYLTSKLSLSPDPAPQELVVTLKGHAQRFVIISWCVGQLLKKMEAHRQAPSSSSPSPRRPPPKLPHLFLLAPTQVRTARTGYKSGGTLPESPCACNACPSPKRVRRHLRHSCTGGLKAEFNSWFTPSVVHYPEPHLERTMTADLK